MKQLLVTCTVLLLLSSLFSCRKKTVVPEEYFSFYADGEFFDYPQEKDLGFGGDGQTLKAKKIGSTDYRVYGYSLKDPVARGAVTITISGAHIPARDTIELDGVSNHASILDFINDKGDYTMTQPLRGRIIFSQRNSEKLVGTFEFEAYKKVAQQPIGGTDLTDTVIHITQGKFSIIPSK